MAKQDKVGVHSATRKECTFASIAQLAEHALRKRTVVGSIPTGGLFAFNQTYVNTQGKTTALEMVVVAFPCSALTFNLLLSV